MVAKPNITCSVRITTRKQLTHVRLGLLANVVKLTGTVSRQLTVPSPHPTHSSASYLHFLSIHVRSDTVQCMDTVTVVCEHTSWDSLFHTVLYTAQAMSVYGLTVSWHNTFSQLSLHIQSCRATSGTMAKGPRGITETGLHPRNLT